MQHKYGEFPAMSITYVQMFASMLTMQKDPDSRCTVTLIPVLIYGAVSNKASQASCSLLHRLLLGFDGISHHPRLKLPLSQSSYLSSC